MNLEIMSTPQLWWWLGQLKRTRNNPTIQSETPSGQRRLARIQELETKVKKELRNRGDEEQPAAEKRRSHQ